MITILFVIGSDSNYTSNVHGWGTAIVQRGRCAQNPKWLLSEVWGRDVIIFYFGELKSRQSKFPMDIVFILWIKIYSTPKIVITITFCGTKSVEASY